MKRAKRRGSEAESRGSRPISSPKIASKCARQGSHYKAFQVDREVAKACLHSLAIFGMRNHRESGERKAMKGGWGEEINYQYGPGSARQVIAVDSPVCHTVNLSLSPGPFHYSTPYLYTAQSVYIGTCPNPISLLLSLSLSLSLSFPFSPSGSRIMS